MTLYSANLEIVISNYLLNGRNISVKLLKVVALRSQKGDGFFFCLQEKAPGRLKYIWEISTLWGGVRSLSPTDWDSNLAPIGNIQ